jgi:hypothetical protein
LRTSCRWQARPPDAVLPDRRVGAREELLRRADLLLDEPALRGLVASCEAQMALGLALALALALEQPRKNAAPPADAFRSAASLLLLAQALRDRDVHVRAVVRYSPGPHPVQRQAFAQAYLDAGRPADALAWLEQPWGQMEDSRQTLLADALAHARQLAIGHGDATVAATLLVELGDGASGGVGAAGRPRTHRWRLLR